MIGVFKNVRPIVETRENNRPESAHFLQRIIYVEGLLIHSVFHFD